MESQSPEWKRPSSRLSSQQGSILPLVAALLAGLMTATWAIQLRIRDLGSLLIQEDMEAPPKKTSIKALQGALNWVIDVRPDKKMECQFALGNNSPGVFFLILVEPVGSQQWHVHARRGQTTANACPIAGSKK